MDKNLSNLLWAKTNPHKSLYSHMKETGSVAKILLTESSFDSVFEELKRIIKLDDKQILSLVCYIVALHDIGKCHPLFQNNAENTEIRDYLNEHENLKYLINERDYRHEIGSHNMLKEIWKTFGRFSKDVIEDFSYIVRVHHQGKKGKNYVLNDPSWGGRTEWREQAIRLENDIYEIYKPKKIGLEDIIHLDAFCIIVSSLTILSDWIASSRFLADTKDLSEQQIEDRIRSFIELSGMTRVNLPNSEKFSSMWPWIDEKNIRPLQSSIGEMLDRNEEQPIITIVEAPMGEGKTEVGVFAAVRMADYWKKNGFYIALPTSATANQMEERISIMLNEHNINKVKLIHSLSWLQEEDVFDENVKIDEIEAVRWLSSSKKALLSPYSVGTVDQVMMATMTVKYGFLRMLGLTGKALIVDEVHAYDAYMSTILKRLLEWCKALHIPVVLLSATLPEWKKRELLSVYGNTNNLSNSYQSITCGYENGNIKEKTIKETAQCKSIEVAYSKYSDIVTGVIEELNKLEFKRGCVCIVVNTVQTAQEIYEKVQKNCSCNTLLFHSRFPVFRRNEIEKECLSLFGKDKSKRPEREILIATQVVEQSLDLDFDYMISEIAPMDLLLQRVGRLHRHSDTLRDEEFKIPKLSVISYEDNNYQASEKIYYKILLKRTDYCLQKCKKIDIPNDIPVMVNEVYQRDDINDSEMEAFLSQMFNEQEQEGVAKNIELWSPSYDGFGVVERKPYFEEDGDDTWLAAKTRLSEKSIKLAILPENIYREAKESLENRGIIGRKLSKEIVIYSCSISEKKVFSVMDIEKLKSTALIAKGILQGMLLFCNNKSDAEPRDLLCETDEGSIIFDYCKGLILKKGSEQNGA